MGNSESGPEVVPSDGVARAVFPDAVNVKQPTSPSSLFHSQAHESAVEADTRQPTHSHPTEGRWTSFTREHSDIPLPQRTSSLSYHSQHVHSIPVDRMDTPKDATELQQSASLFQDSDASDDASENENQADKLLRSIYNLGSDVIEASAAVFHYLETKVMEDEMSISDRSRHVLKMIKKETKRGNMQPAYKFLATAKAVSEVLEEEGEENSQSGVSLAMSAQSHAIYHLLQDEDQHSISEQSAAIFKILEVARSSDGNEEEIDTPSRIQPRDAHGGQSSNEDCNACLKKDWWLPSPKSQETQRASGTGSTVFPGKDTFSDRYLPDIPEVKSTADETEALSQEEGRNGFVENYSEKYDRIFTASSSERKGQSQDIPVIHPVGANHKTFVDVTDLPHLHVVDADMDLEFVENFDHVYNDFVAAHPLLTLRNPDMVRNLRIYKLQKLLEYNELLERNLLGRLSDLQDEKLKMEETMQLQLREGARKKAARQTFLQSELNNLGWSTKRLEAQLRWKSLEYSQDRAKRQFVLRQKLKTIPRANTRNELVQMIPAGPEGQQLKVLTDEANYGSMPNSLSPREEDKLREVQVENSVMSAEIAKLRGRLDVLQMEGKKFAWVESILVKLDEATLFHLKQKFQRKEGLERI